MNKRQRKKRLKFEIEANIKKAPPALMRLLMVHGAEAKVSDVIQKQAGKKRRPPGDPS